MKLKSFTLLLILMISLGTLHAEIHSGTCGANLTWSLNVEDSTLTISGMGEMTSSPWHAYPYSSSEFKLVLIEDGVTGVKSFAFDTCANLISASISSSVVNIGYGAFAGCKKMTHIVVHESNPNYAAFEGVLYSKNLKTLIQYPAGKKNEHYIVDSHVEHIGKYAFENSNYLYSIELPVNLLEIQDYAFLNCNHLTEVIMPNGIGKIGRLAFGRCSNLESVIISESVWSIGDWAFESCTGLTSLTCEATTPPTLGNNVFSYIDKSISLYVPAESIDLYKAADQWKDFTNILPIGGYPSISLPIYIELKDNYGRWLSEVAIRNDYDTAFFYSSSFDYSEYLVYAYKAEDNLWRLIGHTTPEYRFIGWEDKDGKVLNQDTLCLYSSDTVTAVVSEQEYHVQVVPDNYMHGYTKAEYGYAGDTTISYGESINVTAIPREGFQFSRWSDGNTDNPREINILGDLYLTAIFDCQRYGGGWPSEILDTITIERGDPVIISKGLPWQHTIYPTETDYFNDTLRSIFGCDSIVTHYVIVTENKFPVIFLNYNGKVLSRQYVRNGMGAEEPEVSAREGYTFTGWTTDIEHIIDTTYAIAVYDKIGGTVIYKAEDGEIIGSENVDLHLPAAPMISGKTFAGWLTESVDSESGIVLRATYTTDNPTTHDDVSVVPGSTTAAVNFPYITGALTYELVIRDLFGHVVCKILFNSTGHLLGIALAPGRDRSAAPAQTDGFNFTVEGLDPNTTYNYEFVAHDDTDEVIETLSGSFTTTDEISTGVDNVQSNNAQCSKVLRNDHVYILRGDKTYTIAGQEVK